MILTHFKSIRNYFKFGNCTQRWDIPRINQIMTISHVTHWICKILWLVFILDCSR